MDFEKIISELEATPSKSNLPSANQHRDPEIFTAFFFNQRTLFNNHPELDRGFIDDGRCGFTQWLAYWEIFEPIYRNLWPEVSPNPAPVRQITPAGPAFLKLWTERLGNADYKRLFMGGMGSSPMQGHDRELGAFLKAFRHMPDRQFTDLPSQNRTVVCRTLQAEKRSYCYFVNREACPVRVTAEFSGIDSVFSPVENQSLVLNQHRLEFVVPAYGMVSFSYERAGKCTGFQVTVPEDEVKALQAQLSELMESLSKTKPGDYIPISVISPVLEQAKQALARGDIFAAHQEIIRIKNSMAQIRKDLAISKLPVFEWKVIGPFSGDSVAALATAYPPEKAYGSAVPFLNDSYRNGNGVIVAESVRSGFSDVKGQLYPGFVKMDQIGVYYAFTTIRADSPIGCDMVAGIDDFATIVLNGKEVFSAKSTCQGLIPEQYKVPVQLKSGMNYLSLKLVNGGGPGGFCVSFIDSSGAMPKGVHCE